MHDRAEDLDGGERREVKLYYACMRVPVYARKARVRFILPFFLALKIDTVLLHTYKSRDLIT